MIFKKPKTKTIKDMLDSDESRIRGWLEEFLKYRPRLERLDKLYPDTIKYVDLAISKYITLKDDMELPEEFLCSCKLLGLKINEVKRNNSYKEKSDFYISIEFNGVGETCDG